MRPLLSAARVAFICALLGVPSVWSQAPPQAPQQAPPRPIVRAIDVEYTGPATVSKERILAQMRTKVGQPFNDAILEQDVEALYKGGGVQNVHIFGEPQGDGVKVIVQVQTRLIAREIVIEGSERIKAQKLRKEIKLKLNQPIREEDLEEAREKIIEVYQSHGFTDVSVQFRVDPIDPTHGTARVVYTVNEGAKGAVAQINFEGNAHVSTWRLRKEMKTKRQTIVAFLDKSGRLDEVQLQQDLDSIKEFYQNHGYIDAEVSEAGRERRKGGPLIITVGIKEGTLYHVNKLSFAGYKETTEDS